MTAPQDTRIEALLAKHRNAANGDCRCGAAIPKDVPWMPAFEAHVTAVLSAHIAALIAAAVRAREAEHEWHLWLARSGYGLDWRADIDPPCTLTELAAAYVKATEDGESVRTWEWTITEETGPWPRIEQNGEQA